MSNKKVRNVKTAPVDHMHVSERLGYQTHRKTNRNLWTKDEDTKLLEHIDEWAQKLGYGGLKNINNIHDSIEMSKQIQWDQLVEHFKNQNRRSKDLRKRWTSSLDPNLKKGKWTEKEDQMLLEAYKKYGSHWQSVSMVLKRRTEDQCAKRYIEVLRPDSAKRLRPWPEEEDLLLISKVKTYGTKWRKISSEMDCRPSLTCRNRWRKIITLVVRGLASDEITKAVKENSAIDLEEAVNQTDTVAEMNMTDNLNDEITKVTVEEKSSKQNNVNTSLRNNIPKDDIKKSMFLQHISRSMENLPSISRIKTPESAERTNSPSNNESKTHPDDEAVASNLLNMKSTPPVLQSTEWKYVLENDAGESINSGNIDSLALVSRLIEEAKKNSLKISVHQHIHNFYSSAQLPNGSRPNIMKTTSESEGAGTQNFAVNNTTTFYNSNLDHKNRTESFSPPFLSQSPNCHSFGLGASPQPEALPSITGIIHPNFHFIKMAEKSSALPSRSQSPGSPNVSRTSSPNVLNELDSNRAKHFSYLPPTLKLQLGSSGSNTAGAVRKFVSPSGESFEGDCNDIKRQKVSVNFLSRYEESNNDGFGQIEKPASATSRNGYETREDDELDFWEKLRTLAGNPDTIVSETSSAKSATDREENPGSLFDMFNHEKDRKL